MHYEGIKGKKRTITEDTNPLDVSIKTAFSGIKEEFKVISASFSRIDPDVSVGRFGMVITLLPQSSDEKSSMIVSDPFT